MPTRSARRIVLLLLGVTPLAAPRAVLAEPPQASQAEPAAEHAPPGPAADRGTLLDLEDATLYIPRHAQPSPDGTIDVLVHFHGGLDYLARELDRYQLNAVIVYFSPGGRSSAYARPFRDDPDRFGRLLDQARATLRQPPGWPADTRLGRLVVSSFSAGYGAVRELLKSPAYIERIDAIALADSLYAGYAGDPADRVVNPEQMAGFVAFARLAAAGDKAMTLTHSYIVPPGYAGTHETADHLLAELGIPSRALEEPGPGGVTITRRAHAGRLTVWGARGDDAPAHLQHLHHLGPTLQSLGLGTGDAEADTP